MIEMSESAGAMWRQGFAGDTLNTALYLARLGGDRVAVNYVTALGADEFSREMIEAWHHEGLGTDLVARLEGRLPGLYLIRTDAGGERRFFYFRSASAARQLFTDAQTMPLLERLKAHDVIYLSGITLSILTDDARKRLGEAVDAARARGGRIVFDSNYRPVGWPDRATAQRVIGSFLPRADIGLPTFDDESALWGDRDAEMTARRLAQSGIEEIAIKLGVDGCLVRTGESLEIVPVRQRIAPVDTTAAGDAFNAGYLAARLLGGASPAAAAAAGHALAGAKIQHRGAIMPREAMPTFEFAA